MKFTLAIVVVLAFAVPASAMVSRSVTLRVETAETAWRQQAMRQAEYIVAHNANYHSTLMDKSEYDRKNVIVHVPYRLPSVWEPGDVNPMYLNQARNTIPTQ